MKAGKNYKQPNVKGKPGAKKKKLEITSAEFRDCKAVGAQLRKLRQGAEYKSYADFAAAIKMNATTYGSYETGKNMNTIALKRILDFHRISRGHFYDMVDRAIYEAEQQKAQDNLSSNYSNN